MLLPERPGRRRLAWSVLAGAALALGVAGVYVQAGWMRTAVPAAAAADGSALLQRRFDDMRLALKLSDARGQELERQIDALHQRLRECQEELTFFRSAGGRKSTGRSP